MTLIHKSAGNPYAAIPNAVAQSRTLTPAARAILIELLSRPEDWTLRVSQLAYEHISLRSVYRVIRELITAGYIVRTVIHGDNGRVVEWRYEVFYTPVGTQAEPVGQSRPPVEATSEDDNSSATSEPSDGSENDGGSAKNNKVVNGTLQRKIKTKQEKIPASQPTREKASSPKSAKPRPRNPAYDATAEAFPHIKLPALIQKHVSLLTGRDTGRKEEWNEFRLDPGLRPYEIWQFGQWMNERANRMDITAPRQPDKIAQWAEDWRAEVEEDIYQTALINSQTEFVDETGKGHVFSRDTWIDELKERRLREEKEWEQERMKS